ELALEVAYPLLLVARQVADRVLRPLQDLAVQEVDGRREVLVRAERDVQGDDLDPVRLPQLLQDVLEVRVLAAAAAGEDQPRRGGAVSRRAWSFRSRHDR